MPNNTPNPVKDSFKSSPPTPVSSQTFVIAGILCTVYGLSELDPKSPNVSCLWLLHPRLAKQESMAPLAHKFVSSSHISTSNSSGTPGLIAVSFDQRNHGTRLISASTNGAWREGNATHAQDMFSVYHGTQLDVSQLITYLPAYIFPTNEHKITSHMALGVSLGGHCVWHCLLHEPRISTGVVVIGCPDYLKLMTDRARLSKLKTWTETNPPGKEFVGSKDFPASLLEAVQRYDPAGLLMAKGGNGSIGETLSGKRIMNLAGGADKLVPYKQSEGFLTWFKGVIEKGGEAEAAGVTLVDKVYDGVGHEMSEGMVRDAIAFLMDALGRQGEGGSAKL